MIWRKDGAHFNPQPALSHRVGPAPTELEFLTSLDEVVEVDLERVVHNSFCPRSSGGVLLDRFRETPEMEA